MAYRARQGIDPARCSLAVVVQQMVDADAAGVLFTANPTNGRRDEAVIAAAWGLGESVVGGLVDTDDLVVRHGDGQVLSRQTADKAVHDRATPSTAPRSGRCPPTRRTRPVLDDAAAVELAALGARIEAHFGAPQDIEWARAGGAFFDRAGPADHGPARPDRPDPDRLDGARPEGVLRAGQHRRAAARPAHARCSPT